MKSILKSKKGISPILATLLLIVIAVSAVIVTYAWIMTFSESQTEKGAILSVENIRFYSDTEGSKIDITIRNSGVSDATIDAVYVGITSSNLEVQENVEMGIVAEGSTFTLTIPDYDWEDETTYYFNIGTEEGLSFRFNREA
jgi:flagellin-like protein